MTGLGHGVGEPPPQALLEAAKTGADAEPANGVGDRLGGAAGVNGDSETEVAGCGGGHDLTDDGAVDEMVAGEENEGGR